MKWGDMNTEEQLWWLVVAFVYVVVAIDLL